MEETRTWSDFETAHEWLRIHAVKHKDPDCDHCRLFDAFVRRDVATIDEIIEGPFFHDDEVARTFRRHRSEWGEGAWTARDLPAK